jgi:hypothetical protein
MLNCSIFYKKCQEVNTVAKLMLLGTPNSINEKQILNVMDAELKEYVKEEQNDPMSPVNHFNAREWVKYAIIKEYPPGIPWEGCQGKEAEVEDVRSMTSLHDSGVPARLQMSQNTSPYCKAKENLEETLG